MGYITSNKIFIIQTQQPFRLPESVEMGLIFMCDIISFSQFFQFDSVSTMQFQLREKNQESNMIALGPNILTSHDTAFLRLREAATKHGVKLIAKIGSFDDDVMSWDVLSLEISTPEKQANLVEKLMYFVDNYNLDGYVLYLVSPGCPWVRFYLKL
jgi:hypothetical protein